MAIDAHALGRMVLEPSFTVAGALAVVEPQAVADAIALYERDLPPLKEIEPDLNGEKSKTLGNHLRPIGGKMDPKMQGEAATVWRTSMILALSDLPPSIAIRATREAIHRPYQFFNEVEKAIREIAEDIACRRRLALGRLRTMRAEIERAMKPQPALTDETKGEITVEEVAGWLPEHRRMARENGFITDTMFEEAMRLARERGEKSQGDIDTGEKQAD